MVDLSGDIKGGVPLLFVTFFADIEIFLSLLSIQHWVIVLPTELCISEPLMAETLTTEGAVHTP